jgi:N-acetylneuraminic acid mutarotase
VAGGYTDDSIGLTEDVYVYSKSSNKWKMVRSAPRGSKSRFCTVVNNEVYFKVFDGFYVYNADENKWRSAGTDFGFMHNVKIDI